MTMKNTNLPVDHEATDRVRHLCFMTGGFILALVLQFVGQRRTGYFGLGLQLLSLFLFLFLLWRYNCAHR